MSALNEQVYYEDSLNHGGYKYTSLLDLVNNFMENQTGDDTLLGQVTRRKVVYQIKQAIKEFNTSNVNEPKGCEIELNDTLTAIYPHDYVSYCSVSYVNEVTGELMSMTINPQLNTFPSWLQDQNAEFLFDQDGHILEGSSMNAELESQQKIYSYTFDSNCCSDLRGHRRSNFGIDASKNRNGYFNLTKDGIHFGSDSLSKVIMLTYMSDGLESNDDANIKINKLLENAVYAYKTCRKRIFFYT
jgi:hypothetical protein